MAEIENNATKCLHELEKTDLTSELVHDSIPEPTLIKPVEHNVSKSNKTVDHSDAIATAAAFASMVLEENPDATPEEIRELIVEKFSKHTNMFTSRVSAKAKAEAGVTGIDTCEAFVKSTGKKCTVKAQKDSKYCGRHKNYGNANYSGSSTGSTEKKLCQSFKKDGTPCTKTVKDSEYCVAHKTNPILDSVRSETKQCAGKTKKGLQCLKNAREGFDYCMLHTK